MLDPQTKKLLTFGLLDKGKIRDELKRIAILEANKQLADSNMTVAVAVKVAKAGENAPIIVDQYRDLFNDTLPDSRLVTAAETLRYINTDAELSVNLEMINYERKGALERLTLIDDKE